MLDNSRMQNYCISLLFAVTAVLQLTIELLQANNTALLYEFKRKNAL